MSSRHFSVERNSNTASRSLKLNTISAWPSFLWQGNTRIPEAGGASISENSPNPPLAPKPSTILTPAFSALGQPQVPQSALA